MRAALVLVLVSLLFAGCTASDDESGRGDQVPTTEGPAGFDGPITAGTYANDQREAFVAVSADGGTVLTCAHGGFTHASYMYASIDGGANWTELRADPDPAVGGDCEVAISSSGAWAFLHSTVAGATIATTKDQGKAWTVNMASAVPIGGAADRPFIEYMGERLLLAYQPGPAQPGAPTFTYSDDHGATWSTPVALQTTDPTRPTPKMGTFVVSPDNVTVRVPVVWDAELVGGSAERSVLATFAVSRDRGATWTAEPLDIPGLGFDFPAAAEDGQGNLYWVSVTTASITPGDRLALSVSPDGGNTWTASVVVAEDVRWSRPWTHGRPNGTMDLLWQRNAGEEVDIVWSRIAANATVLHEQVVRTSPDFLEYAEITHDASGRAYIAASAREKEPAEIQLFIEHQGTA